MKTLTMLFALLAAQFAGAQSKYTTFGLGPNAGQPPYTVTSINDSGQVLGYLVSNGEAFVISPGDVWTKNIIKTNGSIAMNNAATIAGDEGHNGGPFYKVWEQAAQPFAGCGSGNQTLVIAINTAGLMAGNCPINIQRNQYGVFLGNPFKGTFVAIPFPHDKWPNERYDSHVESLNNLNQIVRNWANDSTATSGFFYDGTSKKLNTTFNMPGAVTTYPVSINDNQEVVGNWYNQYGVMHGFYWNPTAGFSDIDVAGDTSMYLTAINNQSVILGEWQNTNSQRLWHCVTIVNGQPTASINVAHSLAGSTAGFAINNVGQVVGEYETPEGVVRGFIYTPPK
jgi:probable HAF family extracellular repeat protein